MMTLDVALTLFGTEALFDYIVTPHLSYGDYARLSTVCGALRRALRPRDVSSVQRYLRDQARSEGIGESISLIRLIRKLCWRDCLLRHGTLEFAKRATKRDVTHRVRFIDIQRTGHRGLCFVPQFDVEWPLAFRVESCGAALAWMSHENPYIFRITRGLHFNELVVVSRPEDERNRRKLMVNLEMASIWALTSDHLHNYLYNDYGQTRRRVK